MTSNGDGIDKKLREIQVNDYTNETVIWLDDDAIAQIKQVFQEEGLYEPDLIPIRINRSPEELRAISEELSKPRMTGQAWYEAFEKNLPMAIPLDPNGQVEWALEAARRASGLTEEDK